MQIAEVTLAGQRRPIRLWQLVKYDGQLIGQQMEKSGQCVSQYRWRHAKIMAPVVLFGVMNN